MYQANLMCNGEAIASRNGTDSNQLLAWVLTQLESRPIRDDMVGVIEIQQVRMKATCFHGS